MKEVPCVSSFFYSERDRKFQTVQLTPESVQEVINEGGMNEAVDNGIFLRTISLKAEMIRDFNHVLVPIMNVEEPSKN